MNIKRRKDNNMDDPMPDHKIKKPVSAGAVNSFDIEDAGGDRLVK